MTGLYLFMGFILNILGVQKNLEERNYKIASCSDREKGLPHFKARFAKIGNKNTANIIIKLGKFT